MVPARKVIKLPTSSGAQTSSKVCKSTNPFAIGGHIEQWLKKKNKGSIKWFRKFAFFPVPLDYSVFSRKPLYIGRWTITWGWIFFAGGMVWLRHYYKTSKRVYTHFNPFSAKDPDFNNYTFDNGFIVSLDPLNEHLYKLEDPTYDFEEVIRYSEDINTLALLLVHPLEEIRSVAEKRVKEMKDGRA